MPKDDLKEVVAAGPSKHGPVRQGLNDGRLPNGEPDLSPAAGYVLAEPYQYADEGDDLFAARKAMWESAKASAEETQAGGPSFESRRAKAKAKYELELAAIKAEEDLETGPKPVK